MKHPKWAVLFLLFCTCFLASAMGEDLGMERAQMKSILKNVSAEVEKNYYDPTLKGLDWKALTEQAKQKIENAKSPSEMIAAIFVLVDKLHDSHTMFIPPSRSTKLYYGFEAKAVGNDVRVFELKKGYPAELAGLKLGDRIIKMNGFDAERQSFDIMMLNFRALRPRPSWELLVQTGNESPRTVRLEAKVKQRARVLTTGIFYSDVWEMITERQNWEDEHKFMTSHLDGGIGYVWIRAFPFEGEDFLKGLMDDLKGSRAVIVDLRSNPGGAVDTLKNFVGVFEQEPVTIFTTKCRNKDEPVMARPQRPNFSGMPFYILIDSRTGSSAEIFARHFQRSGKAVVVGDESPGRAVVSRQFGGSMGAYTAVLYGIQVGIGRAVFPDGEEIEGKGVKPDVFCIPTGDDMREGKDVCLNKAASLAREKLGIKPAVAASTTGN